MKFWIFTTLLRLPSVFFGVLSVLMVYALGRCIFGEKIAMLSSFFLAVSPGNTYFSGEIRSYALLTFLSFSSVYFFFRFLENKTRPSGLSLYVLSTLLCLYTHYLGIFVVIVEGVFLLLKNDVRGKKIKTWLKAKCVILIFYIPWLFALQRQARHLGRIAMFADYSPLGLLKIYTHGLEVFYGGEWLFQI